MLDVNWLDVMLIVAAVPSLFIMMSIAYSAKSVSNLFFGLAILSFLLGLGLSYLNQIDPFLAREWGDLVSITLVLCGLFVKTRNSKPVFARFPMPMTLLPLLGIFFYPMIIQADVVKDLLRITYQGGAIIVGLLVISINHLMYKHRSLLLISCFVFALAYVGYWFIKIPDFEYLQATSVVLLAVGMVLGALGFRKVSTSKKNIKNNMSLLGAKAPPINLQNGNFQFISLDDYEGKSNVVLLFYPLAFSNVCTKELCSVRDNMKIYESLNAELIAISVDSLFVQKAFKQSQNLNFELVSDFNKEVSRSYGAIYEEYFGMRGVSKRSAFVIDKEGVVRYEEIQDRDDVIPDFNAIQNVLAKL